MSAGHFQEALKRHYSTCDTCDPARHVWCEKGGRLLAFAVGEGVRFKARGHIVEVWPKPAVRGWDEESYVWEVAFENTVQRSAAPDLISALRQALDVVESGSLVDPVLYD